MMSAGGQRHERTFSLQIKLRNAFERGFSLHLFCSIAWVYSQRMYRDLYPFYRTMTVMMLMISSLDRCRASVEEDEVVLNYER